MKRKFKIGDRVRMTPERFREFAGKQGVTDPNKIYVVLNYPCPGSVTISMDKPHDTEQWHSENALEKVSSKPIIIVRNI